MPVHPLVTQLRFSRRELLRCLDGLSEEDSVRRILPMNSIGWTVGHLANQEARYWLGFASGDTTYRWLNDLVGTGKPASTPPGSEMMAVWREVTGKTDPFLDALTPARLLEFMEWQGKPVPENTGTLLLRVTHHYWFHIGQIYAVREMLGHPDLPVFVGDFDGYEWNG